MKLIFVALIALFILNGCVTMENKEQTVQTAEIATVAGGCFWCMEAAFQELDGVVEVINGYTGGEKENPTYEEVSSGTTGHYEAVQIKYQLFFNMPNIQVNKASSLNRKIIVKHSLANRLNRKIS